MPTGQSQPKPCPVCEGRCLKTGKHCPACGGEGVASEKTQAHLQEVINGFARFFVAVRTKQAEQSKADALQTQVDARWRAFWERGTDGDCNF